MFTEQKIGGMINNRCLLVSEQLR